MTAVTTIRQHSNQIFLSTSDRIVFCSRVSNSMFTTVGSISSFCRILLPQRRFISEALRKKKKMCFGLIACF